MGLTDDVVELVVVELDGSILVGASVSSNIVVWIIVSRPIEVSISSVFTKWWAVFAYVGSSNARVREDGGLVPRSKFF